MRSATATALTLAWAKKHVKALPVPADGASGADGAPGPAGKDGERGPQGPQGYGFAPVGKYEHGKVYFGASPENPYFQVVEYMGSSYAALDANGVGGRPPGPGWVLLAAKGAKGEGRGGGGNAQGGLSYDQSLNTTDSVEFAALSINGAPVITPTGTPDGTKYLRDDNTWQPVPGSTNTFEYIDFTPQGTAPAHLHGRVYFDTAEDALTVQPASSATSLQVGQEMWVRAKNSTGIQIDDGVVVYISGAVGASGVCEISKARADTLTTAKMIGVTTENIANGSIGAVTVIGKVRQVDTSAFAEGALLYLSATTAGALTTTRPTSPNYAVPVAVVINSHATNGLFVVLPATPTLGFGTAGYVRAMNSGGTAEEYKATTGSGNVVLQTGATLINPTITGTLTVDQITSYTSAFNTTTDWSGAGPYTITLTQATHACGNNLSITVYKDNGDGTNSVVGNTVDDVGMVNTILNTTTGDVTLRAGTRFAGRVVIVRTSGVGGTTYAPPITTVTTNTTLGVSHYTVLVDTTAGDVTITLPAASSVSGRTYVVKKIDASANDVIFSGTVDGDTNKRLGSRYASLTLQSDGTSWWIL